jgi:hypothetical protein
MHTMWYQPSLLLGRQLGSASPEAPQPSPQDGEPAPLGLLILICWSWSGIESGRLDLIRPEMLEVVYGSFLGLLHGHLGAVAQITLCLLAAELTVDGGNLHPAGRGSGVRVWVVWGDMVGSGVRGWEGVQRQPQHQLNLTGKRETKLGSESLLSSGGGRARGTPPSPLPSHITTTVSTRAHVPERREVALDLLDGREEGSDDVLEEAREEEDDPERQLDAGTVVAQTLADVSHEPPEVDLPRRRGIT